MNDPVSGHPSRYNRHGKWERRDDIKPNEVEPYEDEPRLLRAGEMMVGVDNQVWLLLEHLNPLNGPTPRIPVRIKDECIE